MGGSQLDISSQAGLGTGISFEIPLELDIGINLHLPTISGAVHVLVRKSVNRDVLTVMLGSLGVLGTVADIASVDLLEECCLKNDGVQVVILSASNLAEFRLDSLDRLEKLKLSAHIICLDVTLQLISPRINQSLFACVHHLVDQIRLDWLVELLSSSPRSPSTLRPTLGIQCLVIEDNVWNQIVAKRSLEVIGGSVQIAVSGVEVLALCQRNQFDIIFCNVSIRGLDMNPVVENIRRLPSYGTTPIYALVDAISSETRTEIAGFSGYLTPPILISSFRTLLCKEKLIQKN
jgi:two-component system chemotaxis response regulator CheY